MLRQRTGIGDVEVPPQENLTTSLWRRARDEPDRPAIAVRQGDRFVEWTAQRFAEEVRATAKGLIGLGIEPGQRVCIYSATRFEWVVLDEAIWAIGAVTVPIYETSSAEQVEWIVSDAQAVAIVMADDALRAEYDAVADRLPGCEHVFVFDRTGLDLIQAAGSQVTDETLQQRIDAVTADHLATIVYTSGTTGRAKGCMLTHRNLLFNAIGTEVAVPQALGRGESTLLFLPLAHVFSRMAAVVSLRSGMLLAFSTGIPQLQEELHMVKPSFLFSVPRVFEKILNGAQRKAHEEGKGRIFDHAVAIAERWSRQRQDRGRATPFTTLQYRLFDRLVYSKLREAMGGNVRYAISGGAALNEQIGHLFAGLGITILEGYGLTETTAPAVGNRPDVLRIGTVGQPMPSTSVRIDSDHEIHVKGGNVFHGYLNRPEETAEVLDDDGWFRTGDLGEFDDDGFLRITGRKKEIIITSSGKNVAPAVLEDQLRVHPLISESVVVGDGQPFIGALIALDAQEVDRRGLRAPSEPMGDGQALDEDLRLEIQAAIDDANRAVSRAEQIRAFRVIPRELSVEQGELTPTMKVKRAIVDERYGDLIADIFAASSGSPR